MKNVKMLKGEVQYQKIDDEGLHIIDRRQSRSVGSR